MKTYKITITFDETLRSKRKEEQLAKIIEGAIALARFPDVSVGVSTTPQKSGMTIAELVGAGK